MTALCTRLSISIAFCLLALVPPCFAAEYPKLPSYDSKADPQVALSRALVEAKASNKKILVIAGGDWCVWCHYLESFLKKNKDVDDALHRSFVTLKVYIGPENKNAEFFAILPKANGYPYFWVISSDAVIQHSLSTGTLEDGGKSYNKSKFLKFIRDTGVPQRP